MTPDTLNPRDCALFIIVAFSVAGVCQALWLGSPIARRMSWPLDGGAMWRGRRLLGDHKTVRGFVVMVPATAIAFGVLGGLFANGALDIWPLPPVAYVWLGAWAGVGFMLGELPNSFLKRRLAIPPGQSASGAISRPIFAVVDRLDSPVGLLLALALVVPVPWQTWLYVLGVGSLVHGLFSVLVFHLGGKTRAA